MLRSQFLGEWYVDDTKEMYNFRLDGTVDVNGFVTALEPSTNKVSGQRG